MNPYARSIFATMFLFSLPFVLMAQIADDAKTVSGHLVLTGDLTSADEFQVWGSGDPGLPVVKTGFRGISPNGDTYIEYSDQDDTDHFIRVIVGGTEIIRFLGVGGGQEIGVAIPEQSSLRLEHNASNDTDVVNLRTATSLLGGGNPFDQELNSTNEVKFTGLAIGGKVTLSDITTYGWEQPNDSGANVLGKVVGDDAWVVGGYWHLVVPDASYSEVGLIISVVEVIDPESRDEFPPMTVSIRNQDGSSTYVELAVTNVGVYTSDYQVVMTGPAYLFISVDRNFLSYPPVDVVIDSLQIIDSGETVRYSADVAADPVIGSTYEGVNATAAHVSFSPNKPTAVVNYAGLEAYLANNNIRMTIAGEHTTEGEVREVVADIPADAIVQLTFAEDIGELASLQTTSTSETNFTYVIRGGAGIITNEISVNWSASSRTVE